MDTSKLQIIKQRYNVVGNCDALNRALDVALQVAPTDLSVLIIGESGVGKEIIPRVIHDNSPRKREKYFAINCGSIPEGTIDSELFGHEKGSYTGAIGESEGYFGIANKGTLFLDEVGELPMATQARLLRVLETGEYIRVGGQEIRKTNVRIVAATNVNMRKAISEGKFREDLYYRLNTIPINMPPLRERGNDILLLFRLFAMQMAEKYKLPKITLDDEAKQVMLKYKWPGNVRQLKNITEQMSVIAEKRVIDREEILRFIPQDTESTELALVDKGQGSHSYESEREILYKILYELRGNVSDLRRDLNNVRKQLETYRELEETAHYRHLATEAPRRFLPRPRTPSALTTRRWRTPWPRRYRRPDRRGRRKVSTSTTTSDRWWSGRWSATTATARKRPRNSASATAPSTAASRSTDSKTNKTSREYGLEEK